MDYTLFEVSTKTGEVQISSWLHDGEQVVKKRLDPLCSILKGRAIGSMYHKKRRVSNFKN